MKYLSNCCGHEMGIDYREIMICPDCKEHCDIEEIEEDDWIEQYALQN